MRFVIIAVYWNDVAGGDGVNFPNSNYVNICCTQGISHYFKLESMAWQYALYNTTFHGFIACWWYPTLYLGLHSVCWWRWSHLQVIHSLSDSTLSLPLFIHIFPSSLRCSFSAFDFKSHGNGQYGSPYDAARERRSSQGKMEKSFFRYCFIGSVMSLKQRWYFTFFFAKASGNDRLASTYLLFVVGSLIRFAWSKILFQCDMGPKHMLCCQCVPHEYICNFVFNSAS